MGFKNIVENSDTSKIFEQFNTIIDNVGNFKSQITILQQQLKQLEKGVKKQANIMRKNIDKNKQKVKKAPSGFAKPSKVTNELCKFMNKDEGTEIARTEVTKAIISYIKTNNLEYKENNKLIKADDKLKELLGINDDEELTYFNLQKYMNKHFIGKIMTNADNQ